MNQSPRSSRLLSKESADPVPFQSLLTGQKEKEINSDENPINFPFAFGAKSDLPRAGWRRELQVSR